MTFCHDRSLGERPHFTTEGLRVDGPKERQPGEYPEWFLKYVQWAQQTKHGILILQLTEAYFKLRAQLSAQCQVDPDISQLSILVVWICLFRILLELGDFVYSPPEVKALQMGVRLCEAARADSCLCVWQGWPTDRLLDGLDEGC